MNAGPAGPVSRSDAFNLLLLESTPWGVVTLDRRGCVLAINGRGRKAIERGDGLEVKDGELHAFRSADDRSLQIEIELSLKSACGERPHTGGTVPVGRRGVPVPYGLRVLPMQHTDDPLTDGAPFVIVLIADPVDPGLPSPDDLIAIFGLTPREAEVALYIAHGLSVAEVTDRMEISRNTVRTHLANAMTKTGAHSRGAFIGLIRGLPIRNERL